MELVPDAGGGEDERRPGKTRFHALITKEAMVGSLVSLQVVLCVAFGGFLVVLMVEAYYLLHSRHGSRGAEQSVPSSREGDLVLSRACANPSGIPHFGRGLKHGLNCLIHGGRLQQGSFSRSRLLSSARGSHENRAVIAVKHEDQASSSSSPPSSCSSSSSASASSSWTSFPSAASPPLIHSELVAKLFPLEGGFYGDGDLLQLQALLGPPRLLFTIREETMEDLESDGTRSGAGRSRGASRASSEFIPLPSDSGTDSGTATPTETPFVTPPSSPLPASPEPSPLLPSFRDCRRQIGLGDSSNAYMLQHRSPPSSETTPPIPSPPPTKQLLGREGAPSIPVPAFTASPLSCTPKSSRGPAGAFSDSPSQSRIHPVESFSRGGGFVPAAAGAEGAMVNAFFPCRRIRGEVVLPLMLPPPPSPPSPPTPPLHSAHSSPLFMSPVLCPVNVHGG